MNTNSAIYAGYEQLRAVLAGHLRQLGRWSEAGRVERFAHVDAAEMRENKHGEEKERDREIIKILRAE